MTVNITKLRSFVCGPHGGFRLEKLGPQDFHPEVEAMIINLDYGEPIDNLRESSNTTIEDLTDNQDEDETSLDTLDNEESDIDVANGVDNPESQDEQEKEEENEEKSLVADENKAIEATENKTRRRGRPRTNPK